MESSDLEFLRAQEALRRKWINRDQLSQCLHERGTARGLVELLRQKGWIDSHQVRQLLESTIHTPVDAPSENEEVLAVGDTIAGRYLVDAVKQGGFGRVYLCRTTTGESAALKALRREYLDSPEAREMFQAEALRWIGLGRHPNLVAAYGLEEYLRLPFIVMECVEGGRSLGDVIQSGSDWKLALAFGLQIAVGMDYVGRESGLVHRDLKPVNVMVTSKGTAKVTDFGLSKVRGEADGFGGGTPPYMSPEQWTRLEAVDVRSDVYSFGVILYELATGEWPWNETTLQGFEEAHLRKPPPDPRRLRPDIPEPVAAFVLRCLEKDPSARPRDFGDAAEALRSLGARSFVGEDAPKPDRIHGLINQSRSLLTLQRPREAVQAAREALRLDPAHLEARVAFGNAAVADGDLESAIRVLSDAHRDHPTASAPLVNLALYTFQAGRSEESRRWADLAIRRAPTKDLEALVPILLESGRVQDALFLCERILKEDPKAIIAWNNRSIAQRRLGDLKGALESATRTIELNPRYAKGWSNRATVLVQLERYEEAVESADRALEIDPLLAGAYAAQAAALQSLGRRSQALACLRLGLERIPRHPLLLRALQMG